MDLKILRHHREKETGPPEIEATPVDLILQGGIKSEIDKELIQSCREREEESR